MRERKAVRIRPAHTNDAEEIARVVRASYTPHDAAHIPADLPIYEPAFHLRAMSDPATRWALACENGRPVGVAMWRLVPGVAHLHMLFVSGEAQGRGYGVRLLRHHQTESVRERPDVRIWTLHCLRDSHWAVRFYLHQGYTQYHDGDEWRVPELVAWIDSCKAHDNGWPLRPEKMLFYKHVR
jgi:GNAT superfamily N-acetyltransferase